MNLTLVLNHCPREVVAQIDAAVQQRFGVPPTSDDYALGTLAWIVPRSDQFRWSAAYAHAEALVSECNARLGNVVVDMYLIQVSVGRTQIMALTVRNTMMCGLIPAR